MPELGIEMGVSSVTSDMRLSRRQLFTAAKRTGLSLVVLILLLSLASHLCGMEFFFGSSTTISLVSGRLAYATIHFHTLRSVIPFQPLEPLAYWNFGAPPPGSDGEYWFGCMSEENEKFCWYMPLNVLALVFTVPTALLWRVGWKRAGGGAGTLREDFARAKASWDRLSLISPRTPREKRRAERWALYGLIGFLAILAVTLDVLIWRITRPSSAMPSATLVASCAVPWVSLLVPITRAVQLWRRDRYDKPGLCRACGYPVTGLVPGAKCPECGEDVAASVQD